MNPTVTRRKAGRIAANCCAPGTVSGPRASLEIARVTPLNSWIYHEEQAGWPETRLDHRGGIANLAAPLAHWLDDVGDVLARPEHKHPEDAQTGEPARSPLPPGQC